MECLKEIANGEYGITASFIGSIFTVSSYRISNNKRISTAISQVILLPCSASKGLKMRNVLSSLSQIRILHYKSFPVICDLRDLQQICQPKTCFVHLIFGDNSIYPDLMIMKLLRWHIWYSAEGVMKSP